MNKKNIFIASNNPSKYKKICTLISLVESDLKCLPLPPNIGVPEENGKSELENSIIKANYYSEKLGSPVITEDTGLYIENFPKKIKFGRFIHRTLSQTAKKLNYNNSEIQKYWNEQIENNKLKKGKLIHAFSIKSENTLKTALITIPVSITTSQDENYNYLNYNSHLTPNEFTSKFSRMKFAERKKFYQLYYYSSINTLLKKIYEK